MTQRHAELSDTLSDAVTPAFRGRLLDRGIARSLIWRQGELPEGSPDFANSLTEDLLDYAYTILSMALELRSEVRGHETAKAAFLVAGEAIQAAVHRGDDSLPERGFHRVNAAVAFHLAGYSAMAYSMVPTDPVESNLAPTEEALVLLFRRRLQEMRNVFSGWLRNDENLDHSVAIRLRDDVEFDQEEAVHTLITTSFMRALALFDHAIIVGDGEVANEARNLLRDTANVASQMNFVSHWWTCTLAFHLIDDLWDLTLHQTVPSLPSDDPDQPQWDELRLNYIQSLLTIERPTVELWPSQLQAAGRATNPTDDLVVALPTSAGKTRIAELCILRTLASGQRVVYVTPLRALSAQVERDLAQTFLRLGFSVSSLYSSLELDSGDAETLRQGHIVVSTPEKLSFALRNDATLIDDVGLVVLDEGHMLGPDEREVRYEVLVESLLRREDAANRRIVSLSALFPSPDEMAPLVAWIRQDASGEPIHSNWRPTRQRFGTIRWLAGAGRLDMAVDGQRSFVPRFVEPHPPPSGSLRKNFFPNNKNELTLAAAWEFISQGRKVFVYCPLRKSIEALGKLVLTSIRQGVLTPLKDEDERILDAINTGTEWLGADHPAVQCLHYGVALHHGGLPRPFLNEVERLLRSDDWPLVIASPTLAQGLNLSASVLLIPSIWRNRNIIPSTEFANVAGRAGRAFADLEGLVVHIVWENVAWKRRNALENWGDLVKSTGRMRVVSGLLELTIRICTMISDQANVPFEEVLDYITSNEGSWDFHPSPDSGNDRSEADWERGIASLDTAILSLLDSETEEINIDSSLTQALESSLFSRLLPSKSQAEQEMLPQFVAARAHNIWSATNATQRRGFYLSGVGYQAGSYLNSALENLVTLLLEADEAIENGQVADLIGAVATFADLVCRVAPFRPRDPMPPTWRDGLAAWLEGRPASVVISILGSDGVDFLQDIITYRLPWAMEAVRVHAIATGESRADDLKGLAAAITETGNANLTVHTLIRSGLRSREGAREAVDTTGATFNDRAGMEEWLSSEVVQSRRMRMDWPTSESRHEWEQFYENRTRGNRGTWTRETLEYPAEWHSSAPPSGTRVVFEPRASSEGVTVLSPDFRELGAIEASPNRPLSQIVSARSGDDSKTIIVEFFGPIEVGTSAAS